MWAATESGLGRRTNNSGFATVDLVDGTGAVSGLSNTSVELDGRQLKGLTSVTAMTDGRVLVGSAANGVFVIHPVASSTISQ